MDTEIKVQIIISGKEAMENTEAIAERKGLIYAYSVADYITAAIDKLGDIYYGSSLLLKADTEETIAGTPVTIVYSPLTYAYTALKNEDNVGTELANLMRAMYLYHVAADEYCDPNK